MMVFPCQASNKVRHQTLGSKMDLSRVRSNTALEVVWHIRAVKSGSVWELSPIHPALVLRSPLAMDAGCVRRLM